MALKVEGAVVLIYTCLYLAVLFVFSFLFSYGYIPAKWFDKGKTTSRVGTDEKESIGDEEMEGIVPGSDFEMTEVTSFSKGSVKEGLVAGSADGAIPSMKTYSVASVCGQTVTFVHITGDLMRHYCVTCTIPSQTKEVMKSGLTDLYCPKQIPRGASVVSGALPTGKMTNVELITKQEKNYLFEIVGYIWYCIKWCFDLVSRFAPFAMLVFASLTMFICFHVPLQMGDDKKSEELINTVWSLVLLCLLCEGLKVAEAYFAGNKAAQCSHLTLFAYIVFCFSFIVSLKYLMDEGEEETQKSKPVDMYTFMCQCPGGTNSSSYDNHGENRRMSNEDSSGYEFTCPSADYDTICNLDCGVCGAPFYGVFVSFTTFFTLFFFVSLTFALYTLYYVEFLTNNVYYSCPDVVTFAQLTIHGSSGYGFPVQLNLALDEGLAMVKIFGQIRLDGKHASQDTISDPSQLPPGVQSMAVDGYEGIREFFSVMWDIFRTALKLARGF